MKNVTLLAGRKCTFSWRYPERWKSSCHMDSFSAQMHFFFCLRFSRSDLYLPCGAWQRDWYFISSGINSHFISIILAQWHLIVSTKTQLQQGKLQAYLTAFWDCWYVERHHHHHLLHHTLICGYGHDVSLNQKSISHKVIYFLQHAWGK